MLVSFMVMDHLHRVHVHYFSPLSKFELFISIHTFSVKGIHLYLELPRVSKIIYRWAGLNSLRETKVCKLRVRVASLKELY